MTTIGTPLTAGATRLLLLGAGELGKEVAIEAQRFGVEVIAVDRYALRRTWTRPGPTRRPAVAPARAA